MLLPISFFVLNTEAAFAQSSKMDSLQQELSLVKIDSQRLALLIELAAQWSSQQKDSAEYYFREAERLARELEDWGKLSDVYRSLAKIYDLEPGRNRSSENFELALQFAIREKDTVRQFWILNEFGKMLMYNADHVQAEKRFLQALECAEKIGNKRYRAGIMQNQGNNASRANRIDQAVDYYQKSLSLQKQLGDKGGEALILNLIAYHYMQKGFYPLSLDYYERSSRIQDSLGNSVVRAQNITGIGIVYEAMKDYSEALSHFEQALEILKSTGNEGWQASSLNDIGRIYTIRKEYDAALSKFYEALRLQQKNNYVGIQSVTLANIGRVLEQTNQLDSAEIYLQEALSLARTGNDFQNQVNALIILGKLYHKKGQPAPARTYFEEAFSLSSRSGYRSSKTEAARVLYELSKAQNNTPEALRYHEIYTELRDSLFNEENVKRLAHLELKNELEKEKAELTYATNFKLRRQRIILIATLLTLLLVVIFAFVTWQFYRQKRLANDQLSSLNQKILEQKDLVEEQANELRQLDQAKSSFFTNISHEFRTPLTVIDGVAEQIEENPGRWGKKGAALIKRNSAGLLELVTQILDLRKLESGRLPLDLVQTDIIQHLKYICESLQPLAAARGIELQFISSFPEFVLDHDPEKITRVLSNLLSNAIKSTNSNGTVEVSAGAVPSEEGNPSSALPGTFVLKVKDSGRGIPEDQLPFIFDRFYQLDHSITRQAGGTGIGLSLVAELLQLMNGEIKVESKIGIGTTFNISIPITRDAVIVKKVLREPEMPDRRDNHKAALEIKGSYSKAETPLQNNTRPSLLIIDDNPDIIEYLKACLEDRYELLIAKDGQEGIEVAQQVIPDLIISDVMMPEKDGFEVCQELKTDERTSHIPIILLTAKADHDSRLAGLKMGADAYLSKPFDKEELFIRLEKLHQLRLQLQARYSSLEPLPPTQPLLESPVEDSFIQKLRSLIESKLDDAELSIEQVSKEMFMSRKHLHRKVSALTGQSPSVFIRRIRLHKAKELLEKGELNITQIAYEVGFKNSSYFTTSFKEEFGVPPRQFTES